MSSIAEASFGGVKTSSAERFARQVRISGLWPVRIIGGSGTNDLIDSSFVDDPKGRARFYGQGTVTGVGYGPDTLFNREPWVLERGKLVQPGRGRGAQLAPIVGLDRDHDLGYLARLGASWTRYGFGRRPYASRVELDAEYATIVARFRLGLTADRRYEGTPVHLLASARVSGLEVISFHGFGNLTPDSATNYFDAKIFEVGVAMQGACDGDNFFLVGENSTG